MIPINRGIITNSEKIIIGGPSLSIKYLVMPMIVMPMALETRYPFTLAVKIFLSMVLFFYFIVTVYNKLQLAHIDSTILSDIKRLRVANKK